MIITKTIVSRFNCVSVDHQVGIIDEKYRKATYRKKEWKYCFHCGEKFKDNYIYSILTVSTTSTAPKYSEKIICRECGEFIESKIEREFKDKIREK